MWNARLDEAQAGIKIVWRNINNLRYADDTTLMAESEEELKSLLMKVKVESEKVDLNIQTQHSENEDHGIWSHHFMGNRWGNSGNRDFIFLGSKITANGDCSHEIKTLVPWKKAMTNIDSTLKRRDITFPTNVHLVKAMAFPVVMYGYENWTIKRAECWRIDVFELWCWRRLLRVLWTARRSNQSILKEISPEYSLEGLMLKLKLQYFGLLMWRTDSLEKTLMLVKIEGGRRRGWQRMRWLDGITDSVNRVWVNSRTWWWTGGPGVLWSMGSQRVGHDWVTELNWSEHYLSTFPPTNLFEESSMIMFQKYIFKFSYVTALENIQKNLFLFLNNS